jgi:Inositol-pentakisphosphate 2-kinase.
MDIHHWVYIAEGGKHVIFSYNGKDAKFQGKILRVSKDAIRSDTPVFAASESSFELSHFDAIKRCLQSDLDSSQSCNYLDEPEVIHIGRKYLQSMALKVIESNVVPYSRQSDWTTMRNQDVDMCHSTSPALLMPNYREFPNALSIEIKPKAGYLTTSPLVHFANTCKYKFSRFQILQELNYRGVISKGWSKGSTIDEKSEYDPLDMFSGNFDRICKSIRALFCCPQNNFKVFYGTNMLFGHECIQKNNISRSMDHELFREALGILSGDYLSVEQETRQSWDVQLQSELVDVISKILFQDKLLQRLVMSQKQMDLLDADGAILVYERLVTLCKGSNEMAEKLIDANYNFGNVRTSNLDKFYNYLKECTYYAEECYQDRYNRGKLLMQTLDKADCVELLQKWLLSLVLCDLSIFMIISSRNTAECHQSIDSHHRIQISNGTCRYLQYQIKIIDWDRKPAKKLKNRHELEEKFAYFFHSDDK